MYSGVFSEYSMVHFSFWSHMPYSLGSVTPPLIPPPSAKKGREACTRTMIDRPPGQWMATTEQEDSRRFWKLVSGGFLEWYRGYKNRTVTPVSVGALAVNEPVNKEGSLHIFLRRFWHTANQGKYINSLTTDIWDTKILHSLKFRFNSTKC